MIRQDGRSWVCDLRVDGQRMRRTFPSRAKAEAFEKANNRAEATVGKMFRPIVHEIYGKSKDIRNVTRITEELIHRLGPETMIADITTKRVLELNRELTQIGNKPRTINTKLARLSRILKQCHRLELIDTVPIIDLPRSKGGRTRFLSETEEDQLRRNLPARFQPYFDFLVDTGCRFSEGVNMWWNDLAEKMKGNRHITMATFVNTKSGGTRTIPLTQKAQDAIPWSRRDDLERPFADIDYFQFSNAFRRAKVKAGLGADVQVTPHVLRHTCASRMAQRGVPIIKIKDWLGHENIEMTLIYAKLDSDALDDAVHVLEQNSSRHEENKRYTGGH